jgi:hypothetical protein
MFKRLLFPLGTFVLLWISVGLSPQRANAALCNNKFCYEPPEGEVTCQPQSSGPTTACWGQGPDCEWHPCKQS